MSPIKKFVTASFSLLIDNIKNCTLDEQIDIINDLKKQMHDISPFRNEPTDCVIWVKADTVNANQYNPNTVAPVEFELLRISIAQDGYTQPIVTWVDDDRREVIDGFHRNLVGRNDKDIQSRIYGYLPVVTANENRTDKGDRIASTIRHNRARGKHKVDSMSEIVIELKARNWSSERIGRELGMEEDEVLRLCQITGLASLFTDVDFSRAWDIEDNPPTETWQELTDDFDDTVKKEFGFRTVNTGDDNRVFHTFDKWECYKAGFYNNSMTGMGKQQAEEKYREFLSDTPKFEEALNGVVTEWVNSCEHYLTNFSMNRIAWLGQAALCYATGIPSAFRSGYHLLTSEQQLKADETALIYLNKWLVLHGFAETKLDDARTERQSTIY